MVSARRAAARSFRSGVTVVVTFCLAAACLAFVLVGLGPFTHQYRLLTVQSGSMNPTMPVGSVVAVTPIPLQDIQVGDVITFHLPNQKDVLVTHRVIRVLEAGPHPVLMTKGDANAEPDPWQLRLLDGPAWRVRMVVPHLGYALLWWRQPLVRTLALFVLPLLLAAAWTREIWKRDRTQSPVGPQAIARPG